MSQLSFSDIEYEATHKHESTREKFLKLIDEIVPWQKWVDLIQPFYYKNKTGRPPIGIETMLRMYLIQLFNHLSDRETEDAIYDIIPMRRFMKLSAVGGNVPDATTLLHFRHLMEKHHIGEKLFQSVRDELEKAGLLLREGTIIDSTTIEAPTSTKNASGKRDPEMHSSKKGNAWHFGCKAHIGVDKDNGLVHTVTVTSANVHDITEAPKLIRDTDKVVYGDSGYTGIEKMEEIKDDLKKSKIRMEISMRPGWRKNLKNGAGRFGIKEMENEKSSIRSKVEFVFYKVKCLFKCRKVRYRGLEKNQNMLNMLFGIANYITVLWSGKIHTLLAIRG